MLSTDVNDASVLLPLDHVKTRSRAEVRKRGNIPSQSDGGGIDPTARETQDVTEPSMPSGKTLAEKLDYLFRVVHPRGRGEYTHREVAQAINNSSSGVKISASYVWQLRRGEKENPTIRHVEALARFFGVPASYFLDDAAADEVAEQLALLAAMRDSEVRDIALRASDLSDAALKMVRNVVESTRQIEGLDNVQLPSDRSGPTGQSRDE